MRLFLLAFLWIATTAVAAQSIIIHTVYFNFGKDLPTVESKQKMDAWIASLQSKKIERIRISGYTDKVGSSNLNFDLSDRRAENIKKYLESTLLKQIPLSVDYFGKDSLVVSNDAEQAVNRRVKITVFLLAEKLASIANDTITIEPFIEDVQEQHFAINLDDTVFIDGKEGTTIKINPGSIQNKKGNFMKGQADLVLKEYYEPGDIILAGLNTVSDQGPLQTGGMFYMTIVSNMDSMSPQTLKPVEIRMPKKKMDDVAMNVFTLNHKSDSVLWSNTNIVFQQLKSYWIWPKTERSDILLHNEFQYEKWAIGARQSEDYDVLRSLFPNQNNPTPFEKHIKMDLIKKDSNTLKVDLQVRYRHKGFKHFLTKIFDTSFIVKYQKAEYKVSSNNIQWMNCDRFLNLPNTTELFVSIPNCKGATVMVYFKKLNAFMPAVMKGKKYTLPKVPIQEPITVIAFGRNATGYYYGKKDYTILEKGLVKVDVEKLSLDDFHKQIKGLY